ncbi:MAG: hypothetical protein A2571_03380 [Candidatus Vogelbacteria bacterium RIFOXYD1_FULL_44_32]|uniref:PH domain-containing protein n=1 Tax=Candidatus Vogelbacteria bacterium RIFOXYD1_FULL_44_32 TaxID=1802438 RepID=A0A1G2QE80_9BACT|nr:MAG: hypothetical protein A2571_03380 [Candidatus Vogelbacteria bacterium RIFOXYD1_FULL_44_32]
MAILLQRGRLASCLLTQQYLRPKPCRPPPPQGLEKEGGSLGWGGEGVNGKTRSVVVGYLRWMNWKKLNKNWRKYWVAISDLTK